MNDVIPLKINRTTEAEVVKNNFFNKLFSNQTSLLPILFIFIYGKKGSNFDIFDNISSLAENFSGIFSKLNLTPDNIEKSLKTINSIKPYANPNYSQLIGTFSTILETAYKFSILQNLQKNFSETPPQESLARGPKKTISDRDITFKMIEAIEPLLKEDTRQNIGKMRNMMKTLTTFMDMSDMIGGKKSEEKNGNLDLTSMLGIIGPLLGSDKFIDLDNIEGILKMAELMSIFSEDDSDSVEENKKDDLDLMDIIDNFTNKKRNNKKDNKVTFDENKIIDVEEYDEDINDEDDNKDKKKKKRQRGSKKNNLMKIIEKLANKTRSLDEGKVIDIEKYDDEDDDYDYEESDNQSKLQNEIYENEEPQEEHQTDIE